MKNNKQQGFTIIELLLSMVFGLIVLSGVTYIYIAVIVSSAETLKSSKLNSQMMTVMGVMRNDIRRAGYWGNVEDPASENPFSQVDDSTVVVIDSKSSNIAIEDNTNSSGECILYAYDLDKNGIIDINSEYMGFRLNSGVIQMRIASEVTDGDNCNNGSWADVTDVYIYKITSLSFNPQGSACVNNSEPDGVDNVGSLAGIDDNGERDCYTVAPDALDITVETREIDISMTGVLVSDSDITYTLSETVRVRNDMVRIR
ncbi:PilW family protein [Colwelliaceae bacterium BS250]